jgi:hypothetical protein
MSAGIHNITVEVGATFRLNVTWKDGNGDPIDLTGYEARMQFRKKFSSTTTIMSFTSGAGTIVLGGADGTVAVKGIATLTETITDKFGVYDLELIAPNGDVDRILKGEVEFDPEVTR